MKPQYVLEPKDAQANVNKLIEISTEICHVSSRIKKGTVLTAISKYFNKTNKNVNVECRVGKIWILVKEVKTKKDITREVIQVAQAYAESLDKGFFRELNIRVCNMFDGDKVKNEYKKGKCVFYEVNIDTYLNLYDTSTLEKYVYMSAKEYFAEALIAYTTRAKEWGMYNSGMDRRAFEVAPLIVKKQE